MTDRSPVEHQSHSWRHSRKENRFLKTYPPHDSIGNWLGYDENPQRSDFERHVRETGTQTLTLSILGQRLNSILEEVADIYKSEPLLTKNQAVLGILDGVVDMDFYSDELILFRKIVSLPVSHAEFKILTDRMRVYHKEHNQPDRAAARKLVRNELWGGVNQAIYESKNKFEIREKSAHDAKDINKGLTNGIRGLEKKVMRDGFVLKLGRLALISNDQADQIMKIEHTRHYTPPWKARTISNLPVYEEVFGVSKS